MSGAQLVASGWRRSRHLSGAVWLYFQVFNLIEFEVERVGLAITLAVIAVAAATGAVQQKRAERRARALEAAYMTIAEAAGAVRRAASQADRARSEVTLAETIADAGRVGAPSPWWQLRDEVVAEIDSTIGAIHAEAEYRRGVEARRRRRKRAGAIGAFVTAAVTFIGTAVTVVQAFF